VMSVQDMRKRILSRDNSVAAGVKRQID